MIHLELLASEINEIADAVYTTNALHAAQLRMIARRLAALRQQEPKWVEQIGYGPWDQDGNLLVSGEEWRRLRDALRQQDGVVVPRELYDSCGVFVELGINSDIRPQAIDAVLHAAIRLIRKNAAVQTNAGGQVDRKGVYGTEESATRADTPPVSPAPPSQLPDVGSRLPDVGSDELVKRLRGEFENGYDPMMHMHGQMLLVEAADRIEADQRKIEELQEGLMTAIIAKESAENRLRIAVGRVEKAERRIAELSLALEIAQNSDYEHCKVYNEQLERAEKAEAALKELREQRDREFRCYQSKVAEEGHENE